MTDPSVGQVDDADDIIASLNAMLMEAKQDNEDLREEIEFLRARLNARTHEVDLLQDRVYKLGGGW